MQATTGPGTPGMAGAPVAVARTGYQNFGSFFTDNVEDMIAVPRESYVPPERPFALNSASSLEHAATLPFGEPCRELFMIDFKNWTFINHGAFGGVCRPAHEEANQWREHCEAQPLRFLDRRVHLGGGGGELFPHMVRVIREMADFMGAQPQDLVFVPNATTGLNVAIQAAGLRPGDTMYMLNIGYGSVKKMAQAASAAAAGRGAGTDPSSEAGAGAGDGEAPGGIRVVYGEVTFPISGPRDIVDLVAATLPPGTTLAVFDSVTSNTALRLPVRELTRLARSRGCQVLVDGAHALGQLHLDLGRGVCAGEEEEAEEGAEAGADAGSRPSASTAPSAHHTGAAEGAAAREGGAQGQGDLEKGKQAEDDAEGDLSVPRRPVGAQESGGQGQGQGQGQGNEASDKADDDADGDLSVPDYFVANCHKWLCGPRGSAVLWVHPRRRGGVRPLVVSHGSGCGFTSDFIWDGCRDFTPYLGTSSALALWRRLGPARVRRHCRALLGRAVELLAGRWGAGAEAGAGAGAGGAGAEASGGAERAAGAQAAAGGAGASGGPRGGRLLAPSLDMCGMMALVELPGGLAASEPATSADAKYVQDLLHHRHAVEVPVKAVQGRLYVRLSSHVYNTLDDYKRLADAVDAIVAAEAQARAEAGAGQGQGTGSEQAATGTS
ncbi:hypothetical protein HYH03_004628 [Edaphochlamys debaryana]|uniref:Aminotransferase class V domain-containing protein n=1 Tax=Edaphochlamys debaryana TaxID=47281 RepID=A0A835Y988_9CHLO|nr:hypothetical protein HYH03_004628 [Edaphochlamys debaryana]|eukprot:KAG2497474.1 hypothetical protein HYH03_004628 [Edaphochlamys debaryana]